MLDLLGRSDRTEVKAKGSMFELIYRHDPSRLTERQAPADAAEACRWLEEGNRSFASLASGAPDGRRVVYLSLEDIGVATEGSVPKQQPFAVVLGCSDARVPIELIFDRACNEVFVVRVAGNVLGQEQLGSIDYAVENLGRNLKLLVVLGHSQCGAVTAAVDVYLRPAEYLGLLASHPIRAIVNSLLPAVRGAAIVLAARWGEEVVRHPGYRAALIECAVTLNAALKASILRGEFGEPTKDRGIVFGVYDLGSRRVHVPLPGPEGEDPGIRLVEAPANREAFRQLGAQVAGSPLIARMLGRAGGEAP
jgi:carbonic anhydrase